MPALVSDRKVRIGFVGTGGNARGHMHSVMRMPEAEIVSVCDTSTAAMDRAVQGSEYLSALPRFTDYKEMIEQVKPDGVVISIPHTLHYEAAKFALEHGVSAEVEKPLTCSSAHARDLIATRDRTGLVLTVGYQRHYQGAWRWVHEHVGGGGFGPVHFVEAWQCQNWRGGGWRGVPELSGGGQLNDSGSHLCDILLWSTGIQPNQVFAFQENRGIQVDRISAISFSFPDAGVGTIAIIGDSVGGMDEGVQLYCRDARVAVTGMDGNAKVTWYSQDGTRHDVAPEEMPSYPSGKDANFIQAILGAEEPQAAAETGLAVASFTEAVYASVQQHAPVQIVW